MQVGKKTKAWKKAILKLKTEYAQKGITTCEARLNGCLNNWALGFAHRYKRRDSRCTHDFKGTLLVCSACHDKMEYNKELTEELFERLR